MDRERIPPTEDLAYACRCVVEREHPVLLVTRDDGDWSLLCGGYHELPVLER